MKREVVEKVIKADDYMRQYGENMNSARIRQKVIYLALILILALSITHNLLFAEATESQVTFGVS